jgi:hypothetical protein
MKIFAILALASGTAYAGHGGYTETEQDKADDALIDAADGATQWEAGVGFRVGSFHTANVYNSALGFELAGGMRHGRYAVIGEYTFLGLSTPDDEGTTPIEYSTGTGSTPLSSQPTGIAQRFGATGRYSIFHASGSTAGLGMFGGLYVEAGLGEQLVRWSGGGYVRRPDIAFGLGTEVGTRGPYHHGGVTFGVRVTLASPPASAEQNTSTCAGPCDGPTPPLGIDRSILFTLDFTFGS